MCAKTSSAGPDWFKRINAALLFDNVLDEKEEAIKGEDVEVIEVDNDDDDDDDDDDRDNIEEKENLDRRAYLTSLVNALFATDWLSIETNCEIKDVVPCVEDKSKTATVHLTNNKSLSDVLVVAACIGVEPNGSDLFGDEATAHEKFGFVKSHDTVVTSSISKEKTKTVVAECLSPMAFALQKRSNSRYRTNPTFSSPLVTARFANGETRTNRRTGSKCVHGRKPHKAARSARVRC